MVIYVDVLIFLNTVVDFLILSCVQFLQKTTPKFMRKLVAAFVSALFSLYIFLPPLPLIADIVLRLISSGISVIVCFGFKNIRRYLRILLCFYGISFVYAGIMLGIYVLFRPSSMSVNNSVVYFDISPLVLITVSFVIYLLIIVSKNIFGKQSPDAIRCELLLASESASLKCFGMIDTGHTMKDAFGQSVVLIIDKASAEKLFGHLNTSRMYNLEPPTDEKLLKNFRLFPTKTVTGDRLLPAIKLKYIEIFFYI